MEIGSILLVLALLILVALFVARPFLEAEAQRQQGIGGDGELLAERERILEALLELDFDHQLGKVPEDIFHTQRERLVAQGARVLEQLDARGLDVGGLRPEESDELEAMIAARKAERK